MINVLKHIGGLLILLFFFVSIWLVWAQNELAWKVWATVILLIALLYIVQKAHEDKDKD